VQALFWQQIPTASANFVSPLGQQLTNTIHTMMDYPLTPAALLERAGGRR